MHRLLQSFPATLSIVAALLGYSADMALRMSPSSAGIIGPKDTRMSYPDFAASRYNGDLKALEQFSAAGRFACGETGVSGAIVRRTNILVVAAHALAGKDKNNACSLHANSSGCYFQPIKIDGSFGRQIPIRPDTIKISINYRCDDSEFDNDWAVLNLAADASEVKPFAPLDAARTQPVALGGQKNPFICCASSEFCEADNTNDLCRYLGICVGDEQWRASQAELRNGNQLPGWYRRLRRRGAFGSKKFEISRAHISNQDRQ